MRAKLIFFILISPTMIKGGKETRVIRFTKKLENHGINVIFLFFGYFTHVSMSEDFYRQKVYYVDFDS